MKQLRFLHTADWHADADPKKVMKLQASLDQIINYCKEVKVNAIIHAGDVWERSQKYQMNSGVPVVLKALHELSRLVDFIFITKGNNSHDEPGSISLLHQIEPNIYAYEYPVVLATWDDNHEPVTDLLRTNWEGVVADDFDYIVSLVPYPTKSSFITDDSIDNNNAEFIEKFEQIFEHIGEVTKDYSCPKLLGFHGNVVGSRLSSGQTLVSQDIMVAPSTLEKANHDYYALGHIHLRQFFKPNMGYSGSIYNKSWGETEQKSFEVIEFPEFNSYLFESNQIMLTSARPMVKLECEFTNSEFIMDNTTEPLNADADFRIRIRVRENERNLLTEDQLDFLKSIYGANTKIEMNVIPSLRESRSEQIMNCKSLFDEVVEYASVINESINGTIKEKVAGLQESEAIV